MRKLLVALLLLLSPASWAASLLPNGKQQFFNANGYPLSSGYVYFYVPGTTTPKSTWQDAGQTILNTNPVVLDTGGFALIYGSGSYRQVVKDSLGNTLYDQLTSDTSSGSSSWAGNTSGSANALTVSAAAFSATNGQTISWRNSYTNTGSTTVSVNGNLYAIVKDTATGIVPLTGGELTVGGISTVTFDSVLGEMHLLNPVSVQPLVSTASAATVNLGALSSHNIQITGTTSITSFGSGASTTSPLYHLWFTGATTITYNATSMITPNGANITTRANTTVTALYLGSGNWQILDVIYAQAFPTHQVLTSGSGATYTVPTGATRLYGRMIGGGGGGGGASGTIVNGGAGGASSFGSFSVNGGGGGLSTNNNFAGNGGAGGSGGAGSAIVRYQGSHGNGGTANIAASQQNTFGGPGGASVFGGAGASDPSNTAGTLNAIANTGSGGAGATPTGSNGGSGGGGGAGEYVEFEITNPSATYTYTVGAGGPAGTGTYNAGTGASGVIILDIYYN